MWTIVLMTIECKKEAYLRRAGRYINPSLRDESFGASLLLCLFCIIIKVFQENLGTLQPYILVPDIGGRYGFHLGKWAFNSLIKWLVTSMMFMTLFHHDYY